MSLKCTFGVYNVVEISKGRSRTANPPLELLPTDPSPHQRNSFLSQLRLGHCLLQEVQHVGAGDGWYADVWRRTSFVKIGSILQGGRRRGSKGLFWISWARRHGDWGPILTKDFRGSHNHEKCRPAREFHPVVVEQHFCSSERALKCQMREID